MEIIDVNENNFNSVVDFLKKVETIRDIDNEVIKNASIISLDNEIMGVLSFEKFNTIGLIRYFVFRRNINSDTILLLFNSIIDKSKKMKISNLISLVKNEDLACLFKDLGFIEIEANKVFIEEVNINNTKYKDSIVLKYQIN